MQSSIRTFAWGGRPARHRQFHAGPEMLTILTLSLLPILLLCQETSFDEELLLHPDLVEDDFSPRQTNSTVATTTSLVFGAAVVLLVTGNNSHRVFFQFLSKLDLVPFLYLILLRNGGAFGNRRGSNIFQRLIGFRRPETRWGEREIICKVWYWKAVMIYNLTNCRRKVQEAEEESGDRYKIPEYLEYSYASYSE